MWPFRLKITAHGSPLCEMGNIPLEQPIVWPVDGYVYLSGSLPLLAYR